MIRDNLHLEVVLGLRVPLDEAEMQHVVRSVVDVSLGGIPPSVRQDMRDPISRSTYPAA